LRLLDLFRLYRLNIGLAGAVLFCVAACLVCLDCSDCRRAGREEETRARKVVEAYHRAWVENDMERMFDLSSRRQVRKITGVDPDSGSGARKLALERFSLLMKQPRDVMGYVRFQVESVVSSRPNRIVFKLKAWHLVGGQKKTSMLVRRVVKENGQWKVY
jgi:hypothetical protein